ncbi:MAG: hydrogenase [Euryarchaeota archaeon]|nr:hydrogenase [Euryarchaeota archaeon]
MRNVLMSIVFLILLAFMLYVAINPGDFGSSTGEHFVFGAPKFTDMDNYFIHNGQNQTAANNIVTSIVFDYRGFDTLGEASVLFTAVLGVGVVLRLLGGGRNDE